MAFYTAEDHQQAFELYYQTRSYNRVATQMGLNYAIIQRWSRKDFQCRAGCPYHGWSELITERENFNQARISLLAQEGVLPAEQDSGQSEGSEKRLVKPAVRFDQVLRSDLERLAHWEYLYGKMFFDLTGIALDFEHIQFNKNAPVTATIEEAYRKGLKATSAEGALRCLSTIELHITQLRSRLGLLPSEQDGQPPSISQDGQLIDVTPTATEEQTHVLDELREMRRMLQNTPTEQVQSLITNLRANQDATAKAG